MAAATVAAATVAMVGAGAPTAWEWIAELSGAQAALAASQAEAAALRNNEASLRDELGGASATLREGFAEAAEQGARLAAEEHGRQLKQARLSGALHSARAAFLATAPTPPPHAAVRAALEALADLQAVEVSSAPTN